MSEPRSIGNVNILDLRKTTEKAIAQIGRIGNINLVLYSPETAPLLGRILAGNINVSVELPAEVPVRLIAGSLHVTPERREKTDEPVYLVVMGNLTLSATDSPEAVREHLAGYAGITVMGSILCPETVVAALQAKVNHLMGKLTTFPADAVLVVGSLDLTSEYLESITEPKTIVVTRTIRVFDDVAEAIRDKIEALQVSRAVICAERNETALRSKLAAVGQPHFTVVPDGSRYIEDDLTLDSTTLEGMENARLFVTGCVVIEADVEVSVFERRLDRLSSLGPILCPAALKSVLVKTTDLIENQVIFYEGELWLIDGETTLRPARFDYLEGKATLVVIGELQIDPELAPRLLAERLHKVHNLGQILCTPDQMGALEARLGIHSGELANPAAETPSRGIGNVNMLAL